MNLLRTSHLNPKLSAHALLNGLYNFNANLMAPPSSMILVHEKPALFGTWAAYAVNAWYLGPFGVAPSVLPHIHFINVWGMHRRHSSMVFRQGPNANVLVNGLGHC